MSTPRFKPVPEPPESLDGLSEARQAVPLVPDPQGDCCARLQRQLDLTSRRDAETWLTFLRALELVKRTQRGYARTRDDLCRDELAAAFRERIVSAETALDAAAESADEDAVDAAFEAVREDVPEWEHRRHDDWEAVWRDRTERLLGWGELFDADSSEA